MPCYALEVQHSETPALVLSLMKTPFAVCRLDASASVPPWAQPSELTSVTWTEDELSILAPEACVPHDTLAQRGFRALKVHGPLPFHLVGILSTLLTRLADAKVSVFTISTYETDYILVPKAQLQDAVDALSALVTWAE